MKMIKTSSLFKNMLLFLVAAFSFAQPQHDKKVVGYYAQWAIYARNYKIDDIDGSKLTHLMYAFFGTSYDKNNPAATILRSLDPYADYQHAEGKPPYDSDIKGNMYDLKVLKEKYPHLKILISIGGWTASQDLPYIAASKTAREALAKDMVRFMNDYPFIDGFDVDWEFPLTGGTDGTERIGERAIAAQPHLADDHKNLVALLRTMREFMPNKLVTIAAGNSVTNVPNQFIGPNNRAEFGLSDDISTYCDFITFFGYDFGGNWFDKTSYNAPLYGSGNPNDPLHGSPAQSLEVLVDKFLTEVGFPPEKLIMGLPFYGKLFTNVENDGTVDGLPGLYVNAPRDNNSCSNPQPPKGTWDDVVCQNSGSIEICDLAGNDGSNGHHYLDSSDMTQVKPDASQAGWVRYWDDTAKVPFLYNSQLKQFISYDDTQSIAEKVQFLLSKNLGGSMVWELSQDTRVEGNKNALLSQMHQSLNTTPVNLTVVFSNANNILISGVEVNLVNKFGATIATKQSNSNGEVLFEDVPSFTPYTINYSKSGFSFLPKQLSLESKDIDEDKTFKVNGSETTVTLSGSVKNAQGQLLSDVSIKLKDDSGKTLKIVDSSNGEFTITEVLAGFNYELIGEKSYYNVTKETFTSLSENKDGISLTATKSTHTISGLVKNLDGGISGVTVKASADDFSKTEETSEGGQYEISGLEAGKTYTITATKEGVGFLPEEKIFKTLDENKVQNFELNEDKISGYVKNGSQPVSGAIVQMTLPWTDNDHGYQSLKATTDSDGKYSYENSLLEGYQKVVDIKLNAWENNNKNYYPAKYETFNIPSQPTSYNFNSNSVEPEVTILSPDGETVSTTLNGKVNLKAEAELTYDDEVTTISKVIFIINGKEITATNTTGNYYEADWSPSESDLYKDYTLKVKATDSNNKVAEDDHKFYLNCTGTDCPNKPPTLEWLSPNSTSINQASGFKEINFEVAASDADGNISEVTISIDSATPLSMTAGANNKYNYSFTPNTYKKYNITIKAKDNDNTSKEISKTINVTNSTFTPLPENVVLGYAHSWDHASAPYIYLKDINEKFNVVAYSFIETVNADGFTPRLTINTPKYLENGTFSSQLLKEDILALKEKGIPVIVSIGGQNGHVELETIEQKEIFVAGVKEIIDEYGFDGVDIDFEGTSMDFGAGNLTDFSYDAISLYPKLKNVVDAFIEIDEYYGEGFLITAAPETFYVQVGLSTYTDRVGSFLPVIYNLGERLDLLMVQLYNTGSTNALDGKAYSQATPDFLSSMTDMLITGFDVSATGFHFPGLPASRVIVGIPSCPSAAPSGGYLKPEETIKALDYLRSGTSFSGRSYSLQGEPHPDLRGVMTWSVNWDAAAGCATSYEFADAYSDYFLNTSTIKPKVEITKPSTSSISSGVGASIQLEATVSINDTTGETTISTVKFSINDKSVTAEKSTGDKWIASWTPTSDDFAEEHVLKVIATASNNATANDSHKFKLNCTGTGCVNKKPSLEWKLPTKTIFNHADGFESIEFKVTATDADGTLASVKISTDDGSNYTDMTAGTENSYAYSFTPNAYKEYAIKVKATDDASEETVIEKSITITNSGISVDITEPTSKTVSVAAGSAIKLKASASITGSSTNITIKSVIFKINGSSITATNTSGTSYEATWSPSKGDFNKNYVLNVVATSSNEITDSDQHEFFLECSEGCSNDTDLGDICGVPKWYASKTYSNQSYVLSEGIVYLSNGWIGENETPPIDNEKWIKIGACDPTLVPLSTNCGEAIEWDASKENYNTDNLIKFGSGLYRAKYWVAGNEQPDLSEAYEFIGVCVTPPSITSYYSKAVVEIQTTLENLAIVANVQGFGFTPLTLKFLVKSSSSETYSSYSMTNTSDNSYKYEWTPEAYGDYDIIIKATNSVGVVSELKSTIKIAKSTPPELSLKSPDNESKFIQLNFEPIDILFEATATQEDLKSITLYDLTAKTSSSIAVNSSGSEYTSAWTPTSYKDNNLKLEVTDSKGSSQHIKLSYYIIDPTKEKLSFAELPNQIKGVEGINKVFTFEGEDIITSVLTRNIEAATINFTGKTITITNTLEGRTGLEIKTNNGSYFIGLRIDKPNGEVASLPKYVSIGSVSEDIVPDITFWRDLDNTDLQKNKRVDIRYIYVNGGPLIGWNTWQPDRVTKFTRNSVKLGMIPLYVFYNIPDGGESYTTDLEHVRSEEYMKAYFENVQLFLDHVKQEADDELFLVVLEPDFFGYMQQNNEPASSLTAVGLDEIGPNAGTLTTLVQRINKEFNERRINDNLNMQFGWQYNLWAKPGVAGIKGIVRETDKGDFNTQLEKIKQTGIDIAQYGIDLGTLSHGADFVSIDKYGLDALGYSSGGDDPEGYTWFWNNDHWLNYLNLVEGMFEASKKHVILWQLPVGHINGSTEISAYSNQKFPLFNNTSKHYEDSASTFFFGDTVEFGDNDRRFNYFSENKHNDPKIVIDSGAKKVTFGDHFEEANKAGVRIVLMGAGVGDSTDGVGAPPTDDYFWIQKVQNYYDNQKVIDDVDSDGDGVKDTEDDCSDTAEGETVNAKGCPTSQYGDDDNDGVENYLDKCSSTPSKESVNSSGCSQSQLDDDNDGVNNDKDKCSNTPSGASVNDDGCAKSQLDSDNDGVKDDKDKCLETPSGSSVNNDGCAESQGEQDSDNDGVIDSKDLCSNTPSGEEVNVNGCGVSQLDSDNDGIKDDKDKCPSTPKGEPIDNFGCSQSQQDDDNDGVKNTLDNCPNTPDGEKVDNNGCAESQKDDDNDGITNNKDNCSNTPSGTSIDEKGCSVVQSNTDSDNDGVIDSNDECANTPNGESVNTKGCSQSQLDDDNDGVNNDNDECPNTSGNSLVNESGCFTLPYNNFSIVASEETCSGKDNGKIQITAVESMSYTVSINKQDVGTFSKYFTKDELSPGTYELCISVLGETYEQCYTIEIGDAPELSASIKNSSENAVISIANGTAPYTISLNGIEVAKTYNSSIIVPANKGDLLSVATSVACEGNHQTIFGIGTSLNVLPNPTEGEIQIFVPTDSQDNVLAKIEIYNMQSQIISSANHFIRNGKLQLNLSSYPQGVYLIKVISDKERFARVIKK